MQFANGLRTEFRHSGMSAFCARAFSFRVSFRFRASSAFEVVKSVGSHRFSVLALSSSSARVRVLRAGRCRSLDYFRLYHLFCSLLVP